MDLKMLCRRIGLQEPVCLRVMEQAQMLDLEAAEPLLDRFRDFEEMDRSRLALQGMLGEDGDHMKILTCMLHGAVRAYDWYALRGIGEEIYFDTMGCFSRFLEETRQITGRHDFDRHFWTTRQVGCHLFRLGALEYEIVPGGENRYAAVHIPSDADFSPEQVDASLAMAGRFLREQFPEQKAWEFRCHSWLLEPELRRMLPDGSNIRSFQERFVLTGEGEPGWEFAQWLFRSGAADPALFPEDTSLQRAVKNHLLSGGVIRNVRGVMKHR